MTRAVAVLLAGAALLSGCGWQTSTVDRVGGGPGSPIARRAGSVVFQGCALDAASSATLATAEAKTVFSSVILLCPASDAHGVIAPADVASQSALSMQLASIRALGYQTRLALTMGAVASDGTVQPLDPTTTATALADPTVRTAIASNLAPFVAMADGIDLELPPPPDSSRADVTSLVASISPVVRPGKTLALFVPPVGPTNDVPGAGAYDFASLGALVDRLHIETLDYSLGTPGPTIDPGWAVEVQRDVGNATRAPLDVSYPLYGWDFGPAGQQSVTWQQATSVAGQTRASILRGPTGAPFYDWTDAEGGAHETWFDDAASTSESLRAWDTTTMPGDVGVVFWGLGAEDPSLWPTLAKEMR